MGETLTSLRAGPTKGAPPVMEMSLDRLWKVMRGEAVMTLRHVADLSRVLGELAEGLGPGEQGGV